MREFLDQEFIGALLQRPDAQPEILRLVEDSDLCDHPSQRILAGIRRLQAEGVPGEPGALYAVLQTADVLRAVEFSATAKTTRVEVLARKILERRLREGMVPGVLAAQEALLENGDPFVALEHLGKVQHTAELVAERMRGNDFDSHVAAFERIIDAEAGARIPTGFASIDYLLGGGLTPGDYMLVGGTPGSGKTSWLLNVVLHAIRNGHRAAVLEGEMGPEEVLGRLAAINDGEPVRSHMEGKLYGTKTTPFFAELKRDDRFSLDKIGDRNPRALIGSVVKAIVSRKARLIVVDYLQVFRERSARISEYEAVSNLSLELRGLALKHDVAIVAASSLNRGSVGTEAGPGLHSFRGSGQLEHDCSVGIILREPYEREEGDSRLVAATVVKNRRGPSDVKVMLRFDLPTQRFAELDRREIPAPAATVAPRRRKRAEQPTIWESRKDLA